MLFYLVVFKLSFYSVKIKQLINSSLIVCTFHVLAFVKKKEKLHTAVAWLGQNLGRCVFKIFGHRHWLHLRKSSITIWYISYNWCWSEYEIWRDISFHYEIWKSMSTPTRKCGLVFYPSLSFVNKDHNEEYPLTKFQQFSKCGFGEICSQRLSRSPYIWSW